MNILITGSSGFIGARLILFFIESGHQVTAVDTVSLPHKIDNNALTTMNPIITTITTFIISIIMSEALFFIAILDS